MDTTRLSNRELFERLARAGGDDPLWRELISRFRPMIRLAVLRTLQTEMERSPGLDTGDPHEVVDELTQEVFLRLLDENRRAISHYQGRNDHSAYTYVSTIAVNLVRDHFKKLRAFKKPRASASLSGMEDPEANAPTYGQLLVGEGSGPERFVASQELRDEIRAAIDQVSPRGKTSARDRLIFQLFFIEGLTVDEIAANRSIRLSASGVEKCIRRIREALKIRLSDVPREV